MIYQLILFVSIEPVLLLIEANTIQTIIFAKGFGK